MAEFLNPFQTNVPRKMTREELIRALRQNIAAEEEAITLYMAHAEATDHPLAKKVLVDVANEEREHVGEFQTLLNILDPEEQGFLDHGAEEVREMAEEVEGTSEPAEERDDRPDREIPSVGDLKE